VPTRFDHLKMFLGPTTDVTKLSSLSLSEFDVDELNKYTLD